MSLENTVQGQPDANNARDLELISSDPSRFDLGAIHAFLTTSYWSPGISRETVSRAMSNSLCVGVFDGASQVGFARLITDRATFGYLADVYVLETHRGLGLARQMVEHLLAKPEVQGLRRLLLVTRDAHGLYAKLGFTPLATPERFMERRHADR